MLKFRHIIPFLLIFAAVCFATAYFNRPQNTLPTVEEKTQTPLSKTQDASPAKEGALPDAHAQSEGVKPEAAKSSEQCQDSLKPHSSKVEGASSAVKPDAKKAPDKGQPHTQKKETVSEKKREAADKETKGKSPYVKRKVRFALVIDDFGHSYTIAKQILAMKLTATWAIIPTSAHASEVAKLAVSAGQPFLVHLPMQAVSDKNGSSDYLIGVDTSEEKIHSYVERFHSRFPSAIGVNNHRGSKATSDKSTMRAFMSAMAATEWGFLDSRTIGKTVARKTAQEYHVPTAENRIFIDGTTDLSTMKKHFATALKMAERDGYAIAICHARPGTLPFLRYVSKTDFGKVEFVTVDKLWR